MKPLRRAARWDGVVPIGTTALLIPNDIRTIKDYIQDHRATGAPFDIVAGPPRLIGNPSAAEITHEYEEAGVTWWLEPLDTENPISIEQIRDEIRSGPPGR